MKFLKTKITGIIICEPEIIGDERGYFTETFRKDELESFVGHKINFCQDNQSKSSLGVLRGLHYQCPPFAQSKLVRVIEGSVLDVAVDIRKNSSTFGEYIAIELSQENNKQLFIPRGFAHGFLVLTNTAIVVYKVDNYYDKKSDRGILYNDKDLSIDWGLNVQQFKISEKDQNHSILSEQSDCFLDKVNYYEEN